MANLLEAHWDLADRSRRVMSAYNRKRTSEHAMPRVDIGDYVLYAVHKPDTKLDYIWRGPGVVLQQVSPLVFQVKPAGVEHAKPMEVHVCKLRRFAAASLQLTEQIRTDLARDHPDNIVAKLVAHEISDGEVWFRCRWRGFSKAVDSWQTGEVLHTDCPEVIRKYVQRLRAKKTCDDALEEYFREAFPAETVGKVRLAHVESDTTSEQDNDTDSDATDVVPDTPVEAPADKDSERTVVPRDSPVNPRTAYTVATAAPDATAITRTTAVRPVSTTAVTSRGQPTVSHRYPLRAHVRR